MKETYVKPSIFIERFSLTQNIASGCGGYTNAGLGSPNSNDKYSCVWDMNGVVLFLSKPTCSKVVGENDVIETLCYNAPNSNAAIFGSY